MIDFRYHIVSLISVFLALAVGIVLGAGPLRDYIADSLSGQVDQLRAETQDLREQLGSNQAALENANEFIAEASTSLIAGVLPSYTVSLVTLPGVESETVNAVGDTLTDVEMTPEFTDPAKRPFRSGIAGNLASYMDPQPQDDASAEAVIGSALDQALSRYDTANPQDPAEDALSIIELLRSSDLISVDGEILPTALTVVIASDSGGEEEVRAAELGLVKGTSATRTLIAGTDADGSLLRMIRTDTEAAEAYTTTDFQGRAGTTDSPTALPPRSHQKWKSAPPNRSSRSRRMTGTASRPKMRMRRE